MMVARNNLHQVSQDNQDQVLWRMMVVRTLVSKYDLFSLNGSLITVMTVPYTENAFLFVYSRTIWTKYLRTIRTKYFGE